LSCESAPCLHPGIDGGSDHDLVTVLDAVAGLDLRAEVADFGDLPI